MKNILPARVMALCMTLRLTVLYKCKKFHQNIFNSYQVVKREIDLDVKKVQVNLGSSFEQTW